MLKYLPLLVLSCLIYPFRSSAQTPSAPPKLIIGIVVDQMRYDYLYRYQSKYGTGGFKRLLREGYSCENTHYNYAPTYTGPGHAAIYTGAPPSVNGIIANEWYDREWGTKRYVTTDPTVAPVGTDAQRAGQHSPRVLLSSTVGDELRLFNNFRSKVVGICLKDRGSILPAGHFPNAAYWFDDKTGNWITSSYYTDSTALPLWVQDFNAQRLPDLYLSRPWDKALPGPYEESFEEWDKYDDGQYLTIPENFPYNLPEIKKKLGYTLLRFTPSGNTFTVDFALEAIDKMELGADEYPDLLCLSFSSPDYCGHQFGIHSEETEDMYLRLDGQITRLLKALDDKFGKNNVLVFLTADHGAAETPEHLKYLQVPAGVFPQEQLGDSLNLLLANRIGRPGQYVLDTRNQQVWLNREALQRAKYSEREAGILVVNYLRRQPGVYDAHRTEDWMHLPVDYPFAAEIRRGFHPRRTGDIIFTLEPFWHSGDRSFALGGTTHGSAYAYDTHVPLIWYGWQIPAGSSFAPVNITDIAPTLTAMLRIMEPNGASGQVIQALLR
ncbi:MAG: alkaline phosphatase family protein [Bacteroidetes bacterium]|nr:MAG: alkaline phosphatase family protein [Bacteroidota bacterium]